MFFNIFFPCETSNTSPWDRTLKGQGLGWKLYCSPFFLWKGEKKVMNCYLSPENEHIYTYVHNIYIYIICIPPGKNWWVASGFHIWVAFFASCYTPLFPGGRLGPWKMPGLGSPTRAGRGLAECSFAATPGDRPGVGSWGAFGWMVSWNYAYWGCPGT